MTEQHPVDDAQRSAETRLGPVASARLAHPEETRARQRTARLAPNGAGVRDRVTDLIVALGDPGNPQHATATTELLAIGDAAVPQLCQALSPDRPWLVAFRAAEVLGQIGDGRAAGPLLEALRHSNSNVRWSAVRALAEVGDGRAMLELARLAREDRSKTTWGESVAGAAQVALERLRRNSLLLRSGELLKTAVSLVLMIVALVLAYGAVTALRNELDTIGRGVPQQVTSIRTAIPTTARPAPTAAPTVAVEGTAVAAAQPAAAITVRTLASGNVRSVPNAEGNEPIGRVAAGDVLLVLGTNGNRTWFQVKLSTEAAAGSRINSADGVGWISGALLEPITGDLPVMAP